MSKKQSRALPKLEDRGRVPWELSNVTKRKAAASGNYLASLFNYIFFSGVLCLLTLKPPNVGEELIKIKVSLEETPLEAE